MTRFRPCIDLHAGAVKQIVGGTLSTSAPDSLETNFVSQHSAGHFAKLYRDNGLRGAHVIMLGPGNEDAAREACEAWPGGLQVGGGINADNARRWIELGAEKVIITSYLFPDREFSQGNLDAVLGELGGDRHKLVIDLSCKRKGDTWFVAMNKWQDLTNMELSQESVSRLEQYCSEFLIHAADVEGKQQGIDGDLVAKLAEWCSIPVTYAGGGKGLDDLDTVKQLSKGKVDLTIGSALDIFGGGGVAFRDCVAWNAKQEGGVPGTSARQYQWKHKPLMEKGHGPVVHPEQPIRRGDGTVLLESDAPRNPKKRMWDEGVERRKAEERSNE